MIRNRQSSKVFVVGLDGATLDVIGPWIEEGTLPVLARMAREGVMGQLESTIPPISTTAWASFMSGKNLGKHGIMDFTYRRDGRFDFAPVNATVRDGSTIWRILSDAGKKVGVVNVPMTYPPESVNGFLISGFPVPKDARDYTYPSSLAEELREKNWNLADVATQPYCYSQAWLDKFIEGLYLRLEARTQATLELISRHDWDFFMVHIMETDKVQEAFLNFLDRAQRGEHSPLINRYRDTVLEFFQEVDRHIGRLCEQLGDESILLIMSDHGITPCYKSVHLNNWLLREGYMRFKDDLKTRIKGLLFHWGCTPALFYRLLPQRVRGWAMQQAEQKYYAGKQDHPLGKVLGLLGSLIRGPFLSIDDVDWSNTIAYSIGNYEVSDRLFINLKGRDPNGIVERGEQYERMREELIQRLHSIRDPLAGQKIIERVHRKEEIYEGKYVERAPDLLIEYSEYKYVGYAKPLFLSNGLVEANFFTGSNRANHHLMGMMMLRGAGIKHGSVITGASILDLAPTILYIMGVPVPMDMDGRILKGCFENHFLDKHPEEYIEDLPAAEAIQRVYTPEEEEAMLKMLRDMGYIS